MGHGVLTMNCELLDLPALIAVADGRSFNRAAEQLGLSQPALSRRIQKLEQAVGTRLIERSTRNTATLDLAGQFSQSTAAVPNIYMIALLVVTMVSMIATVANRRFANDAGQ